MPARDTSANGYRFGMFELDLAARQLRKNGYKLRLQEQPMRVLGCLLERPGELVSREELRQKIWPEDTFVEFDDSLNTAVQKIRQALSDDAGSPRFIETVPRQGYRFIAPLEGPPRPVISKAQPEPQPRARHPRAAWILAALALAALPAAFLLRPKPVVRTIYLDVYPPEGNAFSDSTGLFAISPDGSRLAFLAGPKKSEQMLWLRPLDSGHAVSLSGTEGARFPFWAPDGRRLGFFAQGKLWTLDLENGQRRALCEVGAILGATWNQHDLILFSEPAKPLQRVSASGGTPAPALPLNESRKEQDQRHPSFLPDGRHFLFSSRGEKAGVFAGALDDRKERFLADANAGRYLGSPVGSNGYLFYLSMLTDSRKRTLMAVPFDPGKARAIGEPFPVDENVAGGPSFSTSLNGVLAYRKSVQVRAQLIWMDREGKRLGTVGEPVRPADGLSLSGDQRAVAFARDTLGNQSDVWLTDVGRNASTRFSFAPGANRCAVWSPDEKYVAWASTREGKSVLMRREANGQGKDEIVLNTDVCPQSFSPDGRWIAGTSVGPAAADIWLLPVHPEGRARNPIPFLVTPNGERAPQFSPDGQWIAYVSTESAHDEVYVQPVPEAVSGTSGRTGKWQISDAGGSSPRWRGDAKELYYIAGRRKLMAVAVESSSGSLRISRPKQLFEAQFYPEGHFLIPYDVASDGRRFLVSTLVDEDPGLIPITVIVNWRPGIR